MGQGRKKIRLGLKALWLSVEFLAVLLPVLTMVVGFAVFLVVWAISSFESAWMLVIAMVFEYSNTVAISGTIFSLVLITAKLRKHRERQKQLEDKRGSLLDGFNMINGRGE